MTVPGHPTDFVGILSWLRQPRRKATVTGSTNIAHIFSMRKKEKSVRQFAILRCRARKLFLKANGLTKPWPTVSQGGRFPFYRPPCSRYPPP